MNEKLTDMLVAFVQRPQWSKEAVEPENNPEWRAGYEAAQDSLREKLRPWWPLGGPLNLAMPDNPIPSTPPVEEVERVRDAIWREDYYHPKLCSHGGDGEASCPYCSPHDDPTPDDWPADKERAERQARAAIAALRPEIPHDVEIDGLIERLREHAHVISQYVPEDGENGELMAKAATTLEALKGRVGVLEAAAQALIDDVRRRYPNEELRCEYLRKIDALLNSKADTALQSKERN